MIRPLASIIRDMGGVAAAELALMLPLMVMLLFGGMEMGNFFWAEHQVVKSVRNGARFAARQPAANFGCGGSALGTSDAAVRNLVRTGTIDGTGAPVVRGWTDGSQTTIQIAVACDTAGSYATSGIYRDTTGGGTPALSSAMRVQISVDVPFPSLFGSMFFDGMRVRAEGQSPVAGF